jgi:hypothetical protein
MKLVALLATLTVLLVGCGADSSLPSTTTTPEVTSTAPTTTTPPTTTQATTTAPTTTTPPTTTQATTTTEATTTTTTATGPFTVAEYGFFPPVFPGTDAHGSGCAPGTATLPDGIWFGFVTSVTLTSYSFDLACFWTGQAAVDHAGENGDEAYDFYVGNQSSTLRTVPFDPSGTAYWLDASGDLTPQAIPMSDWPVTTGTPYEECPSDHCTAWLYINDGVATELVEQYLP